MSEPPSPEDSDPGVVPPPGTPRAWCRWETWVGLVVGPGVAFWVVLTLNDFHLTAAFLSLTVLAAFLGVGAIAALIGQAVLRPLDHAARHVKGRVQFTLIDFLCLFLWVQAPMALIHGYFAPGESGMRWVLDIYAWLAAAALWGLSVQRLSRAGIVQAGRRALMLVLVIPTTLVTLFATPALAVAAFVWLRTLWLGAELPWAPRYTVLGLLGVLALSSLVVLAASITRRFVAEAASRESE